MPTVYLRLDLNLSMPPALLVFVLTAWTSAAPPPSAAARIEIRAGESVPEPAVVRRRVAAMGTWLSVRTEAPERDAALRASELAIAAIEAVETRLSTWRDESELATLNRAPVGRTVHLSAALASDLHAARAYWTMTAGAFDPSIGELCEIWGLRRGGAPVPSHEAIERARVPGGFGALELDGRNAVRRVERLRIEEGGFGKGVALDAAVAALRASALGAADIDLGGQVIVHGGTSRTFAVADPRDRSRPVLEIVIDSGSLSTTGNSEHAVQCDGRRFGHILDPRSGRPAEDFGSLTVWAPDATGADCLSTALYVMGPERALDWARAHPQFEVLVLDMRSGALVAHATPGLRARVVGGRVDLRAGHDSSVSFRSDTPSR